MTLLRNLRNLAVFVILTVGGLGLTPRPAVAQSCPSAGCGPNVVGCHLCSGRICRSCYDVDQKRRCTICVF
jgi:hypothetical protein